MTPLNNKLHKRIQNHYCPSTQKGAVLLLFLLAIIVGFSALFLSVYSNNNTNTFKDVKTYNKLAEAKKAILDYVSTNYNRVDIGSYGILPCPDISAATNAPGIADNGCLSSHINAIGHLPWRTLGIPPLKDKSDQCFWYVVSGLEKTSNPNTISNGLIDIYAADRKSLLTIAGDSAVAIIIAPNQPLEYQTGRAGSDDSTICEQSYNPNNYMDTTILDLITPRNINNAVLSTIVDSRDEFITADKLSTQTSPPYSSTNPPPYNDQIAYITRDELLAAINKNPNSTTIFDASTAQVSFKNVVANFNVGSGDASITLNNDGYDSNIYVTIDTNNDAAHGGTDYQHVCRWYGDTFEIENKTLRSYFEFKLHNDNSADSSQRCSGFTFTLKPGPSINCGNNGSSLGFAGMTGIGNKSFAVEFDINSSASKNDPANYNHIAVVKGSSNKHTTASNPACLSSGCYGAGNGSQRDITWMEDGNSHSARIEIHTGYPNNSCLSAQENSGGDYILLEAWLDCTSANCSGFGELDSNYTDIINLPKVNHCFKLPTQMKGDPLSGGNGIRFGITAALGGCTTTAPYTDLTISNFGLTIE